MSSWPAGNAYPPPPRSRSRSRSPYAQRAPYPDPAYGDPYRGGAQWDPYARDGPVDRYEYGGRRGRSRSPQIDESVPRKRRRSFSPYERGSRYDPRRRYEDEPGHGYSPPRGRGGAYPSRRPPPQDPYTFEYPASLKQFADWFRFTSPHDAMEEDAADKAAELEAGDGSKPRNGIKARWDKYKKDFAAIQLQTMFNHHRKSPWFAEKYSPAEEFESLRFQTRKVGWKGRAHAFLQDLEAGKFDPENETAERTEETSKETNGATDEPKPQANDDEMDGVEDDDGQRADTNGKVIGEQGYQDIEVHPEGNQVLIRTIPPDIGRIKLEAACSKIPGYVYLALGDPLQKRNYYRAGWLRFQEDADMEKVIPELTDKKLDGFKLHVTYNNRPFYGKVRVAPEATNQPERLAKDLVNAKALVTIMEEEAERVRKFKPSVVKTENGTEESGDAAMGDATAEDEEEPAEKGSEAVARRIEKVMADLQDQNLVDTSDEAAYEVKKTTVALDLYLAYLRAAFHTCYYCAVVTDHLEELHRKCVKHVRKPVSTSISEEVQAPSATESGEGVTAPDEDQVMIAPDVKKEKDPRDGRGDWKRNDEKWLENLDSKIALLLDRSAVDPHDYGGKTYDEELRKATEPHIKQEDDAKFRCKSCLKLFKASSFVEKHLANKHPETLNDLDVELQYFNNFALDPHRIQPFSHPPPTSGNSTVPPQAYGIQASNTHSAHPERHHGDRYTPQHTFIPREEATMARRLSDRITGYPESSLPSNPSLPPKPPASALDSALSAGNGQRGVGGPGPGKGGRGGGMGAPPPPPPANAKEDPRAAGRRVSYHDMDLVAEGDVELSY